MIQKKICMLGAFAVGKTSLVRRFVLSIFSDKYLTTVGVKIDKKSLRVGEVDVNLILWDLAGDDDLPRVNMCYLRGASGYLLVVDGTRRSTLDNALTLQKSVEEISGEKLPFVLLLNKRDLLNEWQFDEDIVAEFVKNGWNVLYTSAKTGHGVEEAFMTLTRLMLGEVK
jgi:small GTP-binding protein